MSVRKVTVLVDMDGVLADFNAGFLEKFRNNHPNKPYIPLNELNTFYAEDQYRAQFGIDVEVRSIIESKGFFLDLPPIDGAIEAMKFLAKQENIDLFICSSPLKKYRHCVAEKYEWVANHFGEKFTEKIILTRDKTLINAHFLIDDKPEITGIHKPAWMHILFETHHNRHIIPNNHQVKAHGWKDCKIMQLITDKLEKING